jgi:hypothetical protein
MGPGPAGRRTPDIGHKFNGNPWMTALPALVRADMLLEIKGCSSLERVGDLRARTVFLSDCPKLKVLGDIRVQRELSFNGCTALVSLPVVGRVGRNLNLRGCTAWDGVVPDGFEVGGKLYTDAHPKGLTLEAYRALQGDVTHRLACGSPEEGIREGVARGLGFGTLLAALAERFDREPVLEAFERMEGLTIPGDFDFRACEWVDRLPRHLTVQGDLRFFLPVEGERKDGTSLNHVASVRELPDGLTVQGDLDMSRNLCLTKVGKGLWVGGKLDLGGCANLKRFDGPPTVGSSFTLWGCACTHLPEGLACGGTLNLHSCHDLVTLPEDLRVGRNLVVSSCPKLCRLPTGLTVKGRLSLWHDEALTALPEGLKVRGDLNISGCLALKAWPAAMRVGGGIEADANPVGDPPAGCGHKALTRDWRAWSAFTNQRKK